jgi:hypothetical protein
MAAREPAHPIEKRDLLHADPPNRSRVSAIASSLASEGRWPEAIDYVEIVRDEALLAKAEAHAVQGGHSWLLQQVERISGKKRAPEAWKKLSDTAARAERWRDAVRALGFAGMADEAEALRAEKCPDYEPFRPLGK